jgi:hypothetical protein
LKTRGFVATIIPYYIYVYIYIFLEKEKKHKKNKLTKLFENLISLVFAGQRCDNGPGWLMFTQPLASCSLIDHPHSHNQKGKWRHPEPEHGGCAGMWQLDAICDLTPKMNGIFNDI